MSDTDSAIGMSEQTPYDVQVRRLGGARSYRVRVTPSPAGTWCLQAMTHDFRPYMLYWAILAPESRERTSWTLWFAFREPPMEHLERPHHDGLVRFLADDVAPHHLMVPGFSFDLFVTPVSPIARGEILQ